MARSKAELAKMVMDNLPSHFADLAKAQLTEGGADLENSPQAAVDNAIRVMLYEDDIMIKSGINAGMGSKELDALAAKGITRDELVNQGFLSGDFQSLDISGVIAASRDYKKSAVSVGN